MRRIALAAAAVIVIAAAAIAYHAASGGGRADYRDPVTLARAMKAQEHGASASCAQLSGLTYLCSVAGSDLSMGTYRVTVAADGSSYTTAVP